MKRPQPPDPDALVTRPARHRRALTEEERALWDAVARSTKPLKARQRKAGPPSDPAALPARVEPSPSPKPAVQPLRAAPPVATRANPAPPPLVALGRRERSQLSRGRKDIEARLDLHGMTQARAHRALLGFLSRASDEGLTFVLVITGKGRANGEDAGRGVLRRLVPEWLAQLEFRAFVVGFEEAHIGHGGGGALYVRVRRPALRGL